MQEPRSELERFHEDGQWFSDHYDELARQYPDQWIAIYKRNIVAASPDADTLFAMLKRQGIPIHHAFCKYLSSEEELWIFAAGSVVSENPSGTHSFLLNTRIPT